MQKKLIVAAVAGALVAPALAYAQSSTVQLYGRAVIEYGYVDQGGNKESTDMLQTPGGSAIGLKGEEKLGGGMSAWFQCESSADIRGENQDGLCTRNSALGFKGGFGNVYIGKWDTPFKKAASVGDGAGSEDTGLLGTAFLLFGSSTGTSTSGQPGTVSVSAAGVVTGNAAATNAGVDRHIWKRRQQNSVNYDSPRFGGFSVHAAYSTGNSQTANLSTANAANPRVMSLAGIYSAGALKLAAGYEKHNEFGGGAGVPTQDDDAWVLSGLYKMGKVSFGGAYTQQTWDQGAGAELKKKAWTLGVDWDLNGPHSVGANYTAADDAKCSNAGCATISNVAYNVAGNTGADLFQIYYGHAFSKRTTAKIAYVNLKNDSNSRYTLGGVKTDTTATQTDRDQNAFVLLVKHNF